MNKQPNRAQHPFHTRIVAYTGVATALVYVATLMGFSTPQFYFNLGDCVILLSSALLGPIPAMIAGGLGSFLADLTVYPATMLYTLAIKAVEGLACGLLCKLVFKADRFRPLFFLLSALFSSSLMALGYFVFQTFVYGTYAAAIVALPMDTLQAAVSSVVAYVALFPFKLVRLRDKLSPPKDNT